MYIYKITNNLNGKIYIGQTIQTVEARFNDHCRNRKNKNSGIDAAIKKYGKENFSIETICEAKTLEELNKLEKYYIKFYNSTNSEIGYNLCEGGNNTKGYHHTEESKKKMSKSRMGIFAGEKNPFYGKKHTLETRQRLREIKTGRKLTDEWKKHLSETSPMKRKVICITTGEKFNSIVEAANKYNLKSTHISAICRGRRNQTKGYKFMYDNTVPSLEDKSRKV